MDIFDAIDEPKADSGDIFDAVAKLSPKTVPMMSSDTPVLTAPAPSNAKPGPYVTQLQGQQEQQFQSWVKQNKIPWRDSPTADYDMRGYWKAQQSGDPLARQAANQHFPDTFKTPYHKTFSSESKYATPGAPHWEGNRLIDANGKVITDETPKPSKTVPMMSSHGAAAQPAPNVDDFGRAIESSPRPAPKPETTPTISAERPGFLQGVRKSIANTAIGHSLQQTMPRVAEGIGLTPDETVYSPEYAQHKEQLVSPEFMVPANEHSPAANISRGVLKGVGSLTSGQSIAMMAGAAATGGLAAPALPSLAKVISAAFGAQAATDLALQAPDLYRRWQAKDYEGVFEQLGRMGFDTAMLHGMVQHAGSAPERPAPIDFTMPAVKARTPRPVVPPADIPTLTDTAAPGQRVSNRDFRRKGLEVGMQGNEPDPLDPQFNPHAPSAPIPPVKEPQAASPMRAEPEVRAESPVEQPRPVVVPEVRSEAKTPQQGTQSEATTTAPLTEQHIAPVVAKIVSMPSEQQGPAVIQVVREATEAITKGGAIVNGKIVLPGNPKAAEKAATQIAEQAIAAAEQPAVPRVAVARKPVVAHREPESQGEASVSPQTQTPQEATPAQQVAEAPVVQWDSETPPVDSHAGHVIALLNDLKMADAQVAMTAQDIPGLPPQRQVLHNGETLIQFNAPGIGTTITRAAKELDTPSKIHQAVAEASKPFERVAAAKELAKVQPELPMDGVQSSAVTSEKTGAGDKSTQPKQETPAGAAFDVIAKAEKYTPEQLRPEIETVKSLTAADFPSRKHESIQSFPELMESLSSAQQSGQRVFVRTTGDLSNDLKRGYSTNYANGQQETGLSTTPIGRPEDPEWDLDVIGRVLHEQGVYGDRSGRTIPEHYLVTGDVVGRGSDGEPLLDATTVKVIGKIDQKVIDYSGLFTDHYIDQNKLSSPDNTWTTHKLITQTYGEHKSSDSFSPPAQGGNQEVTQVESTQDAQGLDRAGSEKPSSGPYPQAAQSSEANPFRERAIAARAKADKLSLPTARDKAMEQSFPLGGGYGRKGGERRIDASVNRAGEAVQAEKDAKWLEAQAAAFDRGEINAQGRSITSETLRRAETRESGAARNAEKISTQGFDTRKVHHQLSMDGKSTLPDGRVVSLDTDLAAENGGYRYKVESPDGATKYSQFYSSISKMQGSGELRKLLTAPTQQEGTRVGTRSEASTPVATSKPVAEKATTVVEKATPAIGSPEYEALKAKAQAAEAKKPAFLRTKKASVSEGGGKQPWEMTQYEWTKTPEAQRLYEQAQQSPKVKAEIANNERFPNFSKQWKDEQAFAVTMKEMGEPHKDAVREALAAGKPVPASVLADYPELKTKADSLSPQSPVGDQRGPAQPPAQSREASKNPLTITPDNLPALYGDVKNEIANSDPKLSPNRAGELAAARIANAIGKAYHDIDSRLGSGISPQEEAFYDRISVDRWNPNADLMQLSGSRTFIADRDNELANRPLDAEPLPNRMEEQSRKAQELSTRAQEVDQQRAERAANAQRKHSEFEIAEAQKKVDTAREWRDFVRDKGEMGAEQRRTALANAERELAGAENGLYLAKTRNAASTQQEGTRVGTRSEASTPVATSKPVAEPAVTPVVSDGQSQQAGKRAGRNGNNPSVISEYHSRFPERESMARTILNRETEKGKPAFIVGEEVYTVGKKLRIADDGSGRGRLTLNTDHDLSKEGFERGLEQSANLLGAEPDPWTSYNAKAKELADRIKSEREMARLEAEQKAEAERQQREAEYKRSSEFRAELDQKLASTKFKQATATLPMRDGTSVQVKGPSIGGLVVHKWNNGYGKPEYQVSHVESGLRVTDGFSNQSDAKTAAVRLAEVGDWKRSAAVLEADKELHSVAGPLAAAMRKHGAYATPDQVTEVIKQLGQTESAGNAKKAAEVKAKAEATTPANGSGAGTRSATTTASENAQSQSSGTTLRSGFLDPELFKETLGKAAEPVKGWLTEKVAHVQQAKDINEDLADMQSMHQADVLRAVQMMKEVPGSAKDQESIYHWEENPQEPVTPEQRQTYEQWIAPFNAESERIVNKLTEGGATVENYVHRVVQERGSLIDRIMAGGKGQGGGNVLSKYAPATKGRTMMAVEDEHGNRRVVSIHGREVTAWNDGTPADLGTISAPDKGVKEYYDKQVMGKLDKLASDLGIEHERVAGYSKGLGGSRLGVSFPGTNRIKTKATSPEQVILHEIGHQLDERYDLQDQFVNAKDSKKELRALADLRHEGQEASDSFKKYVRKGPEKVAAMFEAYLHAPERFKETAPETFKRFEEFLGAHEETKPILDIKPSLVLDSRRVGADNRPAGTFRDKNGKVWNIVQATTKEIEASTDLKYYHNALGSALSNYLNLRKAERAFDYLESLKNAPEFSGIAVKTDGGTLPDGWKPVGLQQLHGYAFEPHVAETLNRYAQNLNRDPGVMDKVNQFLRTSIFFNPLIHVPNITIHAAVEKGITGWMPWNWPSTVRATAKAFSAVVHQNEDYLAALDVGAPLQYQRFENKQFADLFFKKMAEELEGNPSTAKKVADALGYVNPVNLIKAIYNTSGKVTWFTNDFAFLQSAYEKTAKGMPLKEALEETGKHIPTYRMPAHVFGSRDLGKLMENPLFSMFSQYHYGALRSYGEMAKDAFGPDRSVKDRAVSFDKMAMLALMMLVVYPALDKLSQKLSGDKNAKLRRAGAATFPYNIAQLIEGKRTPTEVATSVITPAVGTKAAVELAFNRNLRTGQRIYSPADRWTNIVRDIGRNTGAESISPVSQATRMAEDDTAARKFGWGLVGVSFPQEMSPAVRVARQLESDSHPMGKKTPEQVTHSRAMRAIEDMYRSRNVNRETIDNYVREGRIARRDVVLAQQRARVDPVVLSTRGLGLEQAMSVYSEADEREKRILRPLLIHKFQSAHPTDKTRLKSSFDSLIAPPRLGTRAAYSRDIN